MRKPEIIPECHFLSDCNGYCIFSKTLWSRIIRYPMIFQFQKKTIFDHFSTFLNLEHLQNTWNIIKNTLVTKYKRRTFQPPPPAYDNHAFRPGQAPGGAPGALGGPKQITASSVYQRHNPTGGQMGGQQFGGQGQGQFGQVNPAFTNSYSQFQPQFNQNQAIKPNPLRSYR